MLRLNTISNARHRRLADATCAALGWIGAIAAILLSPLIIAIGLALQAREARRRTP